MEDGSMISRISRFSRYVLLFGLLVSSAVFSQNVRQSIFPPTDKLFEEARAADAELLSPDNYAEATKYYERAEKLLDRGKSLEKIRSELSDSQAALRAAIEASRIAKVTFDSSLMARNDAIKAEAGRLEPELWEKAESQFNSAALKLESGNVTKAKDRANDANADYRVAELAAIETGILGQSRNLIAQAEDDRIGKYAPVTLNKAKALVAQAEADLSANRYETGGPLRLAADAEYEAHHAIYIASQVQSMGKDFTTEDLILQWEEPVRDVALALDVTTDLSAGFDKPAVASITRATELREGNENMLTAIAGLETALGGNEAMIRETERLNRELAQVESLFAPDEARIVREGNDLIIRLTGLSFPSGQSVIETQYFGLLRSVQDAVQVFPESEIVIEGYTDSIGSADLNLVLSQGRADSVRRYLIANLGLPVSRVEAAGFGKNHPIASNDTPQGRAQNRRIDVVIKGARTFNN
jgi:OOP family OmpA-OmpF porin